MSWIATLLKAAISMVIGAGTGYAFVKAVLLTIEELRIGWFMRTATREQLENRFGQEIDISRVSEKACE